MMTLMVKHATCHDFNDGWRASSKTNTGESSNIGAVGIEVDATADAFRGAQGGALTSKCPRNDERNIFAAIGKNRVCAGGAAPLSGHEIQQRLTNM